MRTRAYLSTYEDLLKHLPMGSPIGLGSAAEGVNLMQHWHPLYLPRERVLYFFIQRCTCSKTIGVCMNRLLLLALCVAGCTFFASAESLPDLSDEALQELEQFLATEYAQQTVLPDVGWDAQVGMNAISDMRVITMFEANGVLWVSGSFLTAGSADIPYFAGWDGSDWTTLHGAQFNSTVSTMFALGDSLLVGGPFSELHIHDTDDTVDAAGLALWTGDAWQALDIEFQPAATDGGPAFVEVNSIVRFGDDILIGGRFQGTYFKPSGGFVFYDGLISYDGTEFDSFGGRLVNGNFSGHCRSLIVKDDEVVMTGQFTGFLDGEQFQNIVRYDGSTWAQYANGLDAPVVKTAMWNDNMVVMGPFTQDGLGTPLQSIAMYDGNAWTNLGEELQGNVFDMDVVDNELYVAGNVIHDNFLFVGKRNTEGMWLPLGDGTRGIATRVTGYNGGVAVAGLFSQAADQETPFLAHYANDSWSALGTPLGDAGLPNFNVFVAAIESFGDEIVVGGQFNVMDNQSMYNVAAYNAGTGSWSVLGDGLDGTVLDLYADGNLLYAAGAFVNGSSLAVWDGSAWEFVGGDLVGQIGVIHPHQDKLLLGGSFTIEGVEGTDNLALFDPTTETFSSFAPGIVNNQRNQALQAVSSIAFDGNDMIIGGDFHVTTLLGDTLRFVARYAGKEWYAVGEQLDGAVSGVFAHEGAIEVVGFFRGTTTGTVLNYVAQLEGLNWAPIGDHISGVFLGLNGVFCGYRTSGALYIGGLFQYENLPSLSSFARYNIELQEWEVIGTGMNNAPFTMQPIGSKMYLGGAFTQAGGVTAKRIAAWTISPESDVQTFEHVGMSVYPVPATTELLIKSVETQLQHVTLYDVVGNIVLSQAVTPALQYSIDVSEISAGTYVVVVEFESGKQVTKTVVVQ